MTSGEATVVIATHSERRWDFLVAAVDSVRAQSVPSRLVIAVDHNPALLERVARTWPDVRVVANRHGRGASGTRNTGAELARTELVVFLDDDATARPGWLERLLAPFADPAVVGTGGGVAPAWAPEVGRRPVWFPEEFDWAIGASYRGMPTRTSRIRNVWSENMAVRRSVFESVGGFRTGFGKVGDRNKPEDTDVCIRMGAAVPDGRWMYVPDALVHHHVPRDRSTYRFFLARSFNEGWGKVEMSRLLGPAERLDHERRYLTHTIPRGIGAALGEAASGRPVAALRAGADRHRGRGGRHRCRRCDRGGVRGVPACAQGCSGLIPARGVPGLCAY